MALGLPACSSVELEELGKLTPEEFEVWWNTVLANQTNKEIRETISKILFKGGYFFDRETYSAIVAIMVSTGWVTEAEAGKRLSRMDGFWKEQEAQQELEAIEEERMEREERRRRDEDDAAERRRKAADAAETRRRQQEEAERRRQEEAKAAEQRKIREDLEAMEVDPASGQSWFDGIDVEDDETVPTAEEEARLFGEDDGVEVMVTEEERQSLGNGEEAFGYRLTENGPRYEYSHFETWEEDWAHWKAQGWAAMLVEADRRSEIPLCRRFRLPRGRTTYNDFKVEEWQKLSRKGNQEIAHMRNRANAELEKEKRENEGKDGDKDKDGGK